MGKKIFLIFLLLAIIPLVSSIGYNNPNLPQIIPKISSSGGVSGSGNITNGSLDSTYLRLDTSNDPLLNKLNVNGNISSVNDTIISRLEANGDTAMANLWLISVAGASHIYSFRNFSGGDSGLFFDQPFFDMIFKVTAGRLFKFYGNVSILGNVNANNICYSDGTNCTASGGNSSFNQSLTNTLYAPINITTANVNLSGKTLFGQTTCLVNSCNFSGTLGGDTILVMFKGAGNSTAAGVSSVNFSINGLNADGIPLNFRNAGDSEAFTLIHGNDSYSSPSVNVSVINTTFMLLVPKIIIQVYRTANATVSLGSVAIMAGKSNYSANAGGVIFDFFSDVNNTSTAETSLTSYTIPSQMFATLGDKIITHHSFKYIGSTSSKRIRAYINQTLIYDSTAVGLSTGGFLGLNIRCVETSSSTARCYSEIQTTTATTLNYNNEIDLTSLSFTNPLTLNITGTASGVGASTGDITFKEGHGEWLPAAL